MDEELERRLGRPRGALARIEDQAQEVAGNYAAELEDIARRLEEEIAPLRERAERVLRAARRRLEGIEDAELPEVAELGEEPNAAAEEWLFDSRRGYFEQLRYYKNR